MNASWPGDSATVVRWVRSTLKRMAQDADEVSISGLEDIKVSADLAGTDLQHLTLEATGAKFRIGISESATGTPASAPESVSDSEIAEPLVREAGIARAFRFVARPMRIERIPVTLDLQLYDVPISWLTFAEPSEPGIPESIHAVVLDDAIESVRGSVHAAIRAKDIALLVRSVARRPMLREGGVHLGRVALDVATDGDDSIRVRAFAGLRWKLLLASARAEARIRITPDAVITVQDFTLGSRNVLIKFALLFARKQIRALVGQSVDLNSTLAESGTSARFHDLHLEAGDQLTVSARLS